MATVSTLTIGSDTFSVYALTANPNTDADTFWNGRLGANATAWTGASEDDQNRALVMAVDWLDRVTQTNLSGTKTVASQALNWPRDGATCDGTAVADGTTPDNIADATFWLGGLLLVDSAAGSGSGTGSNVKSVGAGSASVQFFTPTINSITDTRLPIVAMDYIRCYLDGAGTDRGVGVASGTGCSSSFSATQFDLNQGYS
jgi:hypothetical protein